MRMGLQRRIDRIAGTLICGIISLGCRKGQRTPTGMRPRNILIILLSEMGSLVLAYPMFERIKEKFPGASVHVLVFEKNREILEIMRVIPPDRVHALNDASFLTFLKDSLRFIHRCRRLGFDTAIDCELFARIGSLFSVLSGASIRVGFHPHTQEGLYRGDFINRPVLYNPYQHISHQFVTLVEATESETTPKAKREVSTGELAVPPARLEADEISSMGERLADDFPQVMGRELILIYPSGGVLPIRAWPLDYYCRVSEALVSRGYAVGVVGLKHDGDLARSVLSHCRNPRCIDLTGYTRSVRELMLLFHLASLLVTNDGGPGQFAALTPIPSIVLYGPETPTLYRPMNGKAVVFYAPFSCSPCLTAYNHRNSPCDGDNRCLKSIQPETVIEKALEMLSRSRRQVTALAR